VACVEGGTLVRSREADGDVWFSRRCPWAGPGDWLFRDRFKWLQGYKVGYLMVVAGSVTRQGSEKNRCPVRGVAGLVAGVRWVRCRRWEGCPESNGRGIVGRGV